MKLARPSSRPSQAASLRRRCMREPSNAPSPPTRQPARRSALAAGDGLRPAIVGLAARRADDLLDRDDRLGQLVARQVLGGGGEQLGLVGALAGLELDDGRDLLTPALAR